jgi:hypothetical protein
MSFEKAATAARATSLVEIQSTWRRWRPGTKATGPLNASSRVSMNMTGRRTVAEMPFAEMPFAPSSASSKRAFSRKVPTLCARG